MNTKKIEELENELLELNEKYYKNLTRESIDKMRELEYELKNLRNTNKENQMLKYTSFELSKKLWNGGCRLDSSLVYVNSDIDFIQHDIRIKRHDDLYNQIFVYDILWDICIKYRFEFFGNNFDLHEQIRNGVMYYLLSGNNERAENIIWHNCVFNKEN